MDLAFHFRAWTARPLCGPPCRGMADCRQSPPPSRWRPTTSSPWPKRSRSCASPRWSAATFAWRKPPAVSQGAVAGARRREWASCLARPANPLTVSLAIDAVGLLDPARNDNAAAAMRNPSDHTRGLARALAVAALCYVLIAQAVLGLALQAFHNPLVSGPATVLCTTSGEPDADGSRPDRSSQHEMACCLSVSRTVCAPPAMASAGTDWIAPPVFRLAAAVEWDTPPARAGGSVDIDARAARAPPTIAG